MSFVFSGLSVADFQPLFTLSDESLLERQAFRYRVDACPGFPCRITLDDARPGETVLLLNFEHQPAATPYRSGHAIFVRESARQAARFEDQIPPALARRLLSVRAFDQGHMMVDADVADETGIRCLIQRLLSDPRAAYLHAHYARRGCFAARIDRL